MAVKSDLQSFYNCKLRKNIDALYYMAVKCDLQ